ncbi:hypothetical protein SCARD494_08412 [Seiridium cardinale]
MSNRRRYKKRFRSSNLDPSWIIPDDEHDGLSITPSNPSDAASVSSSLADRGSTRDLVRPDHSDRPSNSSGPAPNLGSGNASSFDVSNADSFSYASSNSSVQLAPSSRDEEDARKSEIDGSAALLNPEQTGQAKGRRKKRYVRKHASDWLIDNQDSTSPNTGNGPTSATQPAPQSPDRDDGTWRATAPPPDEKRPAASKGNSSNKILKGLRNKLRIDRSRSETHLALSSATGDTSVRITPDSSGMPSPVESPIRSPAPPGGRRFDLPVSPLREAPSASGIPSPPRFVPAKPAPSTIERQPVPPPTGPSDPVVAAGNSDNGAVRTVGQLPITFAVDISGSTEGRILQQEIDAIRSVSSRFDPPSLASQSIILPWSHKPHSQVSLERIETLSSGGGTDPAVLLEDDEFKAELQGSNLWFLLTDGYIDEPVVRNFANAIPKAGVHGTACVIILFGYLGNSPFECNVSVGMSVFAVAPHCIFLFHDVRSANVYVFQAKGCFSTLLPEDKRFATFGNGTSWGDLARITYGALAQVNVPSATKLSQDTVLLPDGREFNMKDIYNDAVSEADKLDLLSDYSALDVIILAAKTRGKDSEVKRWISNARSANEAKDPLFLQREDFSGNAQKALMALTDKAVSASVFDDEPEIFWRQLRTSLGSRDVTSAKSFLRLQHTKNWALFQQKLEIERDLSSKMNEVLDDVMSTMNSFENERINSPALLTPMSSPGVQRPPPMNDESHSVRRRMSPMVNYQRAPALSLDQYYLPVYDEAPYGAPQGHTYPPAQASTRQGISMSQSLLFLPGFEGARTYVSGGILPMNYDTCALCGEHRSIQTLLISSNSGGDEETQDLPRANRRAKHKYPLVLGNFPETDVILPFTTCDACAFILLQAGELPNGDQVTAALPLVSLYDQGNRSEWLKALSEVYEHRFHEQIVFLVFLSSICSTIEDLVESDEPGAYGLIKNLEWCCKALCKLPEVSTRAGLTPVGSPMPGFVDSPMSLEETLVMAFNSQNNTLMELPFLTYPIEGFVAIIRLADLTEDIESPSIKSLVWKKLLYHILEQHAALQSQLGTAEANAKLKSLIYEGGADDLSAPNPILSFSIAGLSGTYLLPTSSEIVEQFQRMGGHFGQIENTTKFHAPLAVFLHLLSASDVDSTRILDIPHFFSKLRYRSDHLGQAGDGFHDVFDDPKLITVAEAAKMIRAANQLEGIM